MTVKRSYASGRFLSVTCHVVGDQSDTPHSFFDMKASLGVDSVTNPGQTCTDGSPSELSSSSKT